MSEAGWYSAPQDPPDILRWWDGADWTANIATTGAEQVQHQVAPFTPRVLARLVDNIVTGALAAAATVNLLPAFIDDASTGGTRFFASAALFLLVVLVWEWIWLVTEGATPGKQLLGLYVSDTMHPGVAVTPWTATKRVLPLVGVGLELLVSMAWMTLRSDRRSVMDMLAVTTVLKLPPGSPRFTPWLKVTLLVALAIALGGILLRLLDDDAAEAALVLFV